MESRFGWMFFAAVAALVVMASDGESGGERLSVDSADSQLSFNFARTIATGDPGEVHVVWFDTGVRYRRSIDDGRTWLSEIPLSAEGVVSQHAAVAAVGKIVYAAWHELHEKPQLVFRRSLDGGVTWTVAQRLTDPAIASAHPSIAATGSRVHVTWFDGRHGLTEIYTRRSSDRGSTWEPEQRISESDAESWVATIEARGSDVLVAWVDYRDGNEEEYLRRSIDGGATWEPAVRLTDNDADSWAPSIALSGEIALVSWFDRRDAGVTEADVEAKLNEALTLVGLPASPTPPRDPRNYYLPAFMPRLQAKQQALSQAVPAWVASGGDPRRLDPIIRDFQRLIREWMFGWEIYLKRSTDRGRTFGADVRLTHAAGPSQRPSLAMFGDHVSVVWFDDRDGDEKFDIYLNVSRDGGLTWSQDVRLTHSSAMLPSAVRSAEALHVVWVDGRHGPGEIYYQRVPMQSRARPVRR